MALDIQPLSAGRRMTMLVVLFGLLLVSVGFAELLVKSRERVVPVAEYRVIFRAPKGMTDAVPAYESLEGAKLSGEGLIAGRKRRFVAFSYDSDVGGNVDEMQEEALKLREEILGDVEQEPVRGGEAALAGRQAVELEDEFKVAGGAFMMLRLTVLPGRVVAICFSGAGGITDADRVFFDGFCATGVVVNQVVSGN